MNELFEQRNMIYNLRSQTDFTAGPVSTVNNGLKSLRYLGPKFGTLYHLILESLEILKNLRGKLSVGLLKVVLVGYVLITSVTLDMSIRHIFWNQPLRGALANRKSTDCG